MMKKLLRLATVALLFTGVASAQSTGSIAGVVTDGATGKPVVGALVVATSPAVPGQQTAVTDAKGSFTISGLPAGQYKLQTSLEGFKPETRADLALGEGVTLRANLAIVPEAVQLEEVVVTGSRIKRKDLTTPAPVSVVTKEQFLSSGKVSLGEFLQTLPEQGNTVNAQVNNGNDGSVRVNLRSLGSNRTLVLVNGRRMVAGGTGANDGPDLNTIPASAVERIEVLKDGASAVYGSDAIAGVLNVILKKHFNGTEVSAYSGQSGHGDGTTYDLSLTTGTSSEKGGLLFSLGYQDNKPIYAGDRSYSNRPWGWNYQTNSPFAKGSSPTQPWGKFSIDNAHNASNTGTCDAGYAGPPLNQVTQGLCNAYNTYAAAHGGSGLNSFEWNAATSTWEIGDSGYNSYPTNYLLTPGKRLQVFSTGDASIGSAGRVYYEASYVNRQSARNLAPQPVSSPSAGRFFTISKDSLYNPTGLDLTTWSRRTLEFGNRITTQDLDTFRIVTGADGSLGDWAGPLRGWNWGAYYSYGRTQGTSTSEGALLWSKLGPALGPSMLDPVTGKPICVRTPGDASTVIANCIPADFLHGTGTLTPDMKAGMTYVGTTKGENRLEVYSASLGGDLVKLASDRPIAFFAGVDHRKEFGNYIPDVALATGDSTNGAADPTQGSFNTTEYYAELSVPVLSHVMGVEDLELSLAGRTVKYSNFGTNGTYKVGLRYSPVRDYTLRGTVSTAFRAPNIGELYSSGVALSSDFAVDPCANVPAGDSQLLARCGAYANNGSTKTQFDTLQGSNPELKPETATIYTVGMVLEPRFVPNLSMTVDYYNIRVKQTVGYMGAAYIVGGCYLGAGDPSLCSRISRNPSNGFITTIDDKLGNAGGAETSGIDVGLRYGLPLEQIGRFTYIFDGTVLLVQNQTDSSGFKDKLAGTFSSAIGASPRVKFNTGVMWNLGDLGAGVSTRFIGQYKECKGGSCSQSSSLYRWVNPHSPIDVVATYSIKSVAGVTSITAGIQNVLDKDPPAVYSANAYRTDLMTYSVVGRYFYGRLTQSW